MTHVCRLKICKLGKINFYLHYNSIRASFGPDFDVIANKRKNQVHKK